MGKRIVTVSPDQVVVGDEVFINNEFYTVTQPPQIKHVAATVPNGMGGIKPVPEHTVIWPAAHIMLRDHGIIRFKHEELQVLREA